MVGRAWGGFGRISAALASPVDAVTDAVVAVEVVAAAGTPGKVTKGAAAASTPPPSTGVSFSGLGVAFSSGSSAWDAAGFLAGVERVIGGVREGDNPA